MRYGTGWGTRATVAALALASLATTSCSVNPVTGKRELMLLSEDQERQLGAQSDEAIVAQYGTVDDPELEAYVRGIGERLSATSHRPDLPFTFRVLDDPVVNAFALPGGYVYLTRGILAYMTSEAAMAGVLGHEVGHVTARHSAQRYTQQQLAGLGLGVASIVSEDFAKIAGIAGAATQLLFLKFGRDDERQSDALGVEYATKIGYDTHDMADFFGTLDVLSGPSRLPDWASTHPDPGERHETVNRLTDEWQAQTAGSRERGVRVFHEKIDGVAFGPNPREGFVEGGDFKHPDLEFRFPVPSGWRVLNGKTQVQMAEPEGKAAILFTLAAGETDPETAATKFASSSNVQELSRRRLTVGGFPAVRVEARATTEQGTLYVLSTFIAKDRAVFVFHGLTDASNARAYDGIFAGTADGFTRLVDPRALDVQPVRLRVITADRDAPFTEIVAAYPIPARAEIDVSTLAVMNGVSQGDRIARGTVLKVLR